MAHAVVLSFLAGLLGGNAFPHFVRGITKRPYPTVLGSSPVTNLIVGWAGLVGSALLLFWAGVGEYPIWCLLAGALGVLPIGLLHAGPGAFGPDRQTPVGRPSAL